MGLLTTLKPSWWFAAHLHTKFEATVYHEPPPEQAPPPPIANPDEIVIDDEDFDIAPAPAQESEFKVEPGPSALRNPDEITLSDEEDAVVAPPAPVAPPPAPSGHSETKFLALDKCLPKRGFLEVIFFFRARQSLMNAIHPGHRLSYSSWSFLGIHHSNHLFRPRMARHNKGFPSASIYDAIPTRLSSGDRGERHGAKRTGVGDEERDGR